MLRAAIERGRNEVARRPVQKPLRRIDRPAFFEVSDRADESFLDDVFRVRILTARNELPDVIPERFAVLFVQRRDELLALGG